MAHKTDFKCVFLLLWLCSYSYGLDDGKISSTDFCYVQEHCGPDTWPGQCQIGKQQSPIALPFAPHRHTQSVDLDFNQHYYEFWTVNNGHTVQVSLEETPTSSAHITGYEFDYAYKFAQIHFHWGNETTGSEHSINNEFYPMEAHLVHYDSKYDNFTVAANSGDPKALAVIAVFIAEGFNWNYHRGFDIIAANIPKFDIKPTLVRKRLDLSTFLPTKHQHFYRYFGSLTTPPCSENVEWTVIGEPIFVRPSLLRKFRELGTERNCRPIQDIGVRQVQYLSKK